MIKIKLFEKIILYYIYKNNKMTQNKLFTINFIFLILLRINFNFQRTLLFVFNFILL